MSLSNFHGRFEGRRSPLITRCYAVRKSLPQGEPIPGRTHVNKQRERLSGLLIASWSYFVLPHIIHHMALGILTGFPFERRDDASSASELPLFLGPADPCPIPVNMEPFSSSVFND